MSLRPGNARYGKYLPYQQYLDHPGSASPAGALKLYPQLVPAPKHRDADVSRVLITKNAHLHRTEARATDNNADSAARLRKQTGLAYAMKIPQICFMFQFDHFMDVELKHILLITKFLEDHRRTLKHIRIGVNGDVPLDFHYGIFKPIYKAIRKIKGLESWAINFNGISFGRRIVPVAVPKDQNPRADSRKFVSRIEVEVSGIDYESKLPLLKQTKLLGVRRVPVDTLKFHFNDCSEVSSDHFKDLARYLKGKRESLKDLSFSVMGSSSEDYERNIAVPVFEAIKELEGVQRLKLNFSRSDWGRPDDADDYEALDAMAMTLAGLVNLQHLGLGMGYSEWKPELFKIFFDTFTSLNLITLSLDLRSSSNISSDELCRELVKLKKLKLLEDLTIYAGLNRCVNDDLIREFCASLLKIKQLKSLTIELDGTNVSEAGFKHLAEFAKEAGNLNLLQISAVCEDPAKVSEIMNLAVRAREISASAGDPKPPLMIKLNLRELERDRYKLP